MGVFINLSNHRSENWGNDQIEAASRFGEIVDLPFPNVEPGMEIQPAFMTQNDSTGYVVECEDYHEEFRDGDIWRFNILFFGKVIAYFGQVLDALFRLGAEGIPV